MTQRREQGNIIGFVAVGVLLLALLAAGIYMLRGTLGLDGLQTGGSQKTVTSSTEVPTEESATDGPSPSEANKDLKEALAAQASAEKKAAEQQKAQQAEALASDKTTPQNGTATTTTGAVTQAALPTTGPEEVLAPLLGAALLAAAGVAFIRSRSLI
jgi:hypothetical protein